jgi:hypothetical protein
MYSLEDALASFNRKEHNLLVQAMLRQEGPLCLSERFRKQVATKLGLQQGIPESAAWATDYHISWLAGALALFVRGEEETARDMWKNPEKTDDRWPNLKKPDGRRLVEGNQDDIDLVIATGRELILIEAKAYGHWENEQLASKLARLELLHDFYCKELVVEQPSEDRINFHLLLISPNPPEKLDPKWPGWACVGQDVPWIPLKLDKTKSIFEVTRCSKEIPSTATGELWRVNKVSSAAACEPTSLAT